MSIGPGEWLIIMVILLVLFGGKKIPEIARGLGQAQREFRRGLEDDEPAAPTSPPPETVADQPSATAGSTAVPIDQPPASG